MWEGGFRLQTQVPRWRMQDTDAEHRIGDAEVGFRMRKWDGVFRLRDGGCDIGFRMETQGPRYRTEDTDAGHRRGAAEAGFWVQMQMWGAGHGTGRKNSCGIWDGGAGHRIWDADGRTRGAEAEFRMRRWDNRTGDAGNGI